MPKIKGKGNETGIESVHSHQKTSDLIEKEIRHFLRSSKKPAIHFKIPGCGTESRKNLKVIYREIELLHLARTKTYHSSDLIGTTIISIVIGAVGKTKLNLGITPGLPILFLVTVLISSLIPLYIKKKKDWLIHGHRSGGDEGVVTFRAPQAVWHTHRQRYYRVPSHRALSPNPALLHSLFCPKNFFLSTL